MVSRIRKINDKGLIQPPKWLTDNVHYEVITGSVSYAVSSDTSDMDVVGFAIPPKSYIFPHTEGEIMGFGTPLERFEQYQQHHVMDKEENQEYDFTIYSIVKYFNLCMENNPNMVDTLFTPQRCVLFASKIGQVVRDNRKLFLHKGSYHKFRGYAYAQLDKIDKGSNKSNPKRQESIEKFGYDVKFAYHVVRLALEGEQILREHDLNIEQNSEILKSIRRGEWSIEKIKNWFNTKELLLEELYSSSTLQLRPNEEAIKRVLVTCLENHYGDLSKAVVMQNEGDVLAKEMMQLLNKHGYH